LSHPSPTVWAVHDGKSGMANQALGLAEAVGWPFIEKRLAVRAPWRHLAPNLWFLPLAAMSPEGARLAPPWPDLVIGCGRNAVAPSLAAKRASRGRTLWVQIQDPRFARAEADLLVVPRHDPARGQNVLTTLGAVHRVTPARLTAEAGRFAAMFAALPRPRVAVLIGGDNSVYRLSSERFAAFVDQLAALAGRGCGLMVTPSRRTGPEAEALIRTRLQGLPAFVWDGSGENPYFGMLGLADAVIVTADSVSMVSEAAATGRPVHVVPLEGGSTKFARFHQAMEKAGVTRPFHGAIEQWSYTPPDDNARAGAAVRALLARRQSEVA
jgi:mitochondrial fission protein ELM1